MGTIIKIALIMLVIGIGFYFPKSYNEYYERTYGDSGLCYPLSIITAILCIVWLLGGEVNAFWFWFLLILFAASVVLSILYCVGTARQVNATVFDTVISVIAQLLSTAGIVIFVLLIVAALNKESQRRKK